MRSLLLLTLATGCTVGTDGDQTEKTTPDPLEEVNGYCTCSGTNDGPCAGCRLETGTCLDLGPGGPCEGGGSGTLSMQVDGVVFESLALAAGRWGRTLQISATAGNEHTIVLDLLAEVGEYDCTSALTKVTYYKDGQVSWNRAVQSPRPPCTISVTAAGATIDGMFAVSLTGAANRLLTQGAFSVTPVDY